jgi:citrate lyase subunit beta/citryl-CoA lyase
MLKAVYSWLFVPGASEKMLAKASSLEADAVILDLEDAVAPDQKLRARDLVARTLRAGEIAALTFVRVNPLDEGLGHDDIARVLVPGLSGVVLPKASSAEELENLDHALRDAETAAGIPVGSVLVAALVETPQGVLNAPQLARGPRVCAICLGGEDLSLSLGARRTFEGHELDFARAMVITSAAAADVQAVDTVWTDVRDLEGLDAECRRVRDLGFTGKLAIHPGQLDTIQKAFGPGPEEVEAAQRIVEAFDASATGVAAIDGKMIDAPIVERARRLLAERAPASKPSGGGGVGGPEDAR